MKAIIGKKVGMSQIFDENGHVIPVTVIEAGPCTVVQKKTSEKEGYNAVQLGYEDVAEKKLTKGEMGHLNKAGVSPKKHLREFDLDNAAELNIGDIVKADTFQAGDFVDITGISKGHGYQGVIKRWGAQRTPTSHGGGPVHRHAGSMGSSTDPSRIFKGKIGAGQMGNEQVTVMNLDVVKVDAELGVIALRGAVPGPKNGVVFLHNSVKKVFEAKGAAGMVGLETAFAVCYTKLCRMEGLPLEMLSFLMSSGPAQVLGLDEHKGRLVPGFDADIVLVDTDHMFTVHADELHSKSKNCPYDGALLYGKVVTTIKGGKVTFQIEE